MRLALMIAALATLVAAAAPARAQDAAKCPVAASPAPNSGGGRVIGGARVADGTAPWTVEIYLASDFSGQRQGDLCDELAHDGKTLFMAERPDWDLRHLCGSALIAPGWVVTAAHCVLNFADPGTAQSKIIPLFKAYARLRMGSQDISSKSAASCQVLEVRMPRDGDIALIRFDPSACSPVPGPIAPIRILETAPTDQHRTTFNTQTAFSVFGWGMTQPRPADAIGVSTANTLAQDDAGHIDHNSADLLFAVVNFIPTATCRQRPDYQQAVSDGMLCAGLDSGAKDQCDGDSGGPLTLDVALETGGVEHLLVGLVHGSAGCGQKRTPGLYVYVPQYLPWIERTLGHGRAAAGRALLARPAANGST
jgi:secreted trypsin-like serine protease